MKLFTFKISFLCVLAFILPKFSSLQETASGHIELYVENRMQQPLNSNQEKAFEMIGMQIFDAPSRSSNEQRQRLANTLLSIKRSHFLNVYFVIIFDRFRNSGSVIDAFSKLCHGMLNDAFASEGKVSDVFAAFCTDAVNYASKNMQSVHPQIQAAFKNIQKVDMWLEKHIAVAEFKQHTNPFDCFLEDAWEKYFFKIKCVEVSNCDLVCAQHCRKFNRLTENTTPKCILEASKIRARKIMQRIYVRANDNTEIFVQRLNECLVQTGRMQVGGFEKLSATLEFKAFYQFVIEQIQKAKTIITMKNLAKFFKDYFAIRNCNVSSSGTLYLWKHMLGSIPVSSNEICALVQTANELMLSTEAWKEIAKLVQAFCIETGMPLSNIFLTPFAVKNVSKPTDILSHMNFLCFGIGPEPFASLTQPDLPEKANAAGAQQPAAAAQNDWLINFDDEETAPANSASQLEGAVALEQHQSVSPLSPTHQPTNSNEQHTLGKHYPEICGIWDIYGRIKAKNHLQNPIVKTKPSPSAHATTSFRERRDQRTRNSTISDESSRRNSSFSSLDSNADPFAFSCDKRPKQSYSSDKSAGSKPAKNRSRSKFRLHSTQPDLEETESSSDTSASSAQSASDESSQSDLQETDMYGARIAPHMLDEYGALREVLPSESLNPIIDYDARRNFKDVARSLGTRSAKSRSSSAQAVHYDANLVDYVENIVSDSSPAEAAALPVFGSGIVVDRNDAFWRSYLNGNQHGTLQGCPDTTGWLEIITQDKEECFCNLIDRATEKEYRGIVFRISNDIPHCCSAKIKSYFESKHNYGMAFFIDTTENSDIFEAFHFKNYEKAMRFQQKYFQYIMFGTAHIGYARKIRSKK